ncbi:hypothetical protein MmiHf6_02260 [Methanimicrococcus hongohii]|uniref:Uncharacterized protein n=1 Tax=Methanimicrococcus hongohii TaxID=3028295 RepID=A0AA96UZH8_9EURY|nr:hypothetical protein MmiHf6_02260 [Methanimicrococcus sp. Hf6]
MNFLLLLLLPEVFRPTAAVRRRARAVSFLQIFYNRPRFYYIYIQKECQNLFKNQQSDKIIK